MTHSGELKPFVTKLKTVFDRSPEGMVISDMTEEDEPIIYCNDSFLNITGYKKEEIIGYNCRFLQGDERDQAGLQLIRSAIKSSQSCRVVLRNYRKNGSLFYNRLSLFPIINSEGETEYYMGLQDDITSLVDKNKQINKLESERQVLESEVHHRVKNNLAVVSSLLDLEMGAASPSKTLQKTRMRIRSMATIHENLYQKNGFSRVDYGPLLFDITNSFKKYRDEKQAKLNFIIEADSVSLNVNQAIPLSIIMSELVHNIYKHAYPDQENGQVHIRLSEEKDDSVSLEVIDNGRGLENDIEPRESGGMGFLVIDTLAKQIGAELTINDSNKKSSGFSVTVVFEKSDSSGSSQGTMI